jgi:hypothetical protein
VIARRREDAAAGDRMTVDRRNHRLRQRQCGAQEVVEDGKKPAAVFRTVLEDAKQVDAGRERRS